MRLESPSTTLRRALSNHERKRFIQRFPKSNLPPLPERFMNEETFNLSIRAFLKRVGINSQREIEQAVAKAIETGAINGAESFPATMTLEIAGLKLHVKFDGEIRLE
jgi:hypothetical protein